jgi:hypothetical protein
LEADADNSFPILSVIDNDNLSAAGAISKMGMRKQKSKQFRARRREIKMALHGSQFNIRDGVKNPMR